MKTVRTVTPSSAPVACAIACALACLVAGCGKGDAPGDVPAAGTAPVKPASEGKGSTPGGKPAGKGQKGGASALLAYQTGLQLLLKGDPEKALTELQRATELDPQMSEAFYELGKLQVHFSSKNVGSQARDLDILDKGLAALEKASELEPANDQYRFWVGRTYFLRNDSEKALANLLKAVELNPKHAPAWKALGLVQKDEAQTEAARASFEKAIENDARDAGSHFQLGQTLEVLTDLAGARAAYEKSIELDPTEPDVYGRLTQVCAKLGDAACEARAQAGMKGWMEFDIKLQRRRREVNQKPGDAGALRLLGEMYFEVGKWEEALDWFLRSLHIDPKDGLTHVYCGVIRRHMKDYVNAANHLKEAEFLAPDNLDPKLELLRLYADSQDTASLSELLASVESAAEEDGEALFALGEVCVEIARGEDATRLFAKAAAKGVTAAAGPTDAAGEAR